MSTNNVLGNSGGAVAPPLVSVIVPVYNGARFLSEAIESVWRQEVRPLEVIIIDDGSTDDTAAVIQNLMRKENHQCRIRYRFQTNAGPSAARNTGLAMANGELIRFLDADDLWIENSLELQLRSINQDPKTDIVLGHTQYLRLLEGKYEPVGTPFLCSAVESALFRKSVFTKVGEFAVGLRFGEDVDWFTRAREQNVSILVLDAVTALYRQHESNMTRDINAQPRSLTKVLHQSLERRRAVHNGVANRLPDIIKSPGNNK